MQINEQLNELKKQNENLKNKNKEFQDEIKNIQLKIVSRIHESQTKQDENNILIKQNEEFIRQNNILKQKNDQILKEIQESQAKFDQEKQTKEQQIDINNDNIYQNLQKIRQLEEQIQLQEKDNNKEVLLLKEQGAKKFQESQYKEAREFFERALYQCEIEQIDLRTKLNSNIGICLKQENKYEEAINFFNEALLLNPKFIKAQVNKAECYYQLKNWEECMNEYKKLEQENEKFINKKKYAEVKINYEKQMEKQKEQVMGQLKDLGNKFLGNFGMNLDNFKLQDNGQGGYNVSYQNQLIYIILQFIEDKKLIKS